MGWVGGIRFRCIVGFGWACVMVLMDVYVL